MDIKTFLSNLSPDEKKTLANDAKTSVAYLSQLASGYRLAGLKTAANKAAATQGQVSINDLRPDLFCSHPAAEIEAENQ